MKKMAYLKLKKEKRVNIVTICFIVVIWFISNKSSKWFFKGQFFHLAIEKKVAGVCVAILSTCLRKAFKRADSKSVKRNIVKCHQYLFALMGSACAKVARKTLVKLTPGGSVCETQP